jgi:hypothetical protein
VAVSPETPASPANDQFQVSWPEARRALDLGLPDIPDPARMGTPPRDAVSDHDQPSAASYDLSEAALKELYDDQDADRPDKAEDLIGFTDDRAPGPRQGPSESVSVSTPRSPVVLPSGEREEQVGARISSSSGRRRRLGVAVVVALIAAVLIFGGLLSYPLFRAQLAPYFPETSLSITGVLRVADLAAGHAINPGETYGVDIPSGKAQIAVLSGQVALKAKNGSPVRACSNQSFTVVAKGLPASDNPFISSCGGAQAFIQAVIPQPPLPSSLPGAP